MIGKTLSIKVLSPGQVLSDVTAQTVVISTPTNIYASTSSVTSAIASAASKYFNTRMYQASIGSNLNLDSSYFGVPGGTNGVNYPGGTIQKSSALFFNSPSGDILFGNHNTLWVSWFRIGMSVLSSTSFTLYLFDADDNIAIFLEPPTNKVGTVSTVGTAVTGTGTAFLTDFAVGDTLYISSGAQSGHFCRVASIINNTSMTLTNAFQANVTGATYKVNKLIANYANQSQQTPINTSYTISPNAAGNWILHILTNNNGLQGGVNIHTDILSNNQISIQDLGQ